MRDKLHCRSTKPTLTKTLILTLALTPSSYSCPATATIAMLRPSGVGTVSARQTPTAVGLGRTTGLARARRARRGLRGVAQAASEAIHAAQRHRRRKAAAEPVATHRHRAALAQAGGEKTRSTPTSKSLRTTLPDPTVARPANDHAATLTCSDADANTTPTLSLPYDALLPSSVGGSSARDRMHSSEMRGQSGSGRVYATPRVSNSGSGTADPKRQSSSSHRRL